MNKPDNSVIQDAFDELATLKEEIILDNVEIPPQAGEPETIDEWDLIESILPKSRRVLLYGPPGTGKTHAGTYLNTEGKTVYSLTLTEATPDAELRGHFVPAGEGKFRWMHGPAILAWLEGCPLVINEINRGSPEAQSFLYVLLDDPRTARITLPTGETVTPKDGFRVVATMNGRPDELPEALRDRFPVSIEVSMTNPAAFNLLPHAFQKLARDTASLEGDRRITIRSWLAFTDALLNGVGVDKAGKGVFNSAWPDLRAAVLTSLIDTPSKKRAAALGMEEVARLQASGAPTPDATAEDTSGTTGAATT